jgi:hypothetical protein
MELQYLDNKLQQVASLWEETQLFVLCSLRSLPLGRARGLHRDHEPRTIAI